MYSDATGLGAEEALGAAMFESHRFEVHHVACRKTRNFFSMHIRIKILRTIMQMPIQIQ